MYLFHLTLFAAVATLMSSKADDHSRSASNADTSNAASHNAESHGDCELIETDTVASARAPQYAASAFNCDSAAAASIEPTAPLNVRRGGMRSARALHWRQSSRSLQPLPAIVPRPPVAAPTAVGESNALSQGFPDRGPRAQILAPDRLFLGPLGLKYMH